MLSLEIASGDSLPPMNLPDNMMLIKELYQISPQITEAVSLLTSFRDLAFKGIQLSAIDKQECTLGNIAILIDLMQQGSNAKSPEFQAEFLSLSLPLMQRLTSSYCQQLTSSQEGIIWLLAANCYINKSATRIGSDA